MRANTPGQVVPIYVAGDVLVQGVNFNVQIGDGGLSPGGTAGPAIESIDLQQGTIFGASSTGELEPDPDGPHPDPYPQIEWRTTTTRSPDRVLANGLLATITIDTTGLYSGQWELRLSDTVNGSTDFAGIPIQIQDGAISLGSWQNPDDPCDVNGDGAVWAVDVLTLINYINAHAADPSLPPPPETPPPYYDVNADGACTAADPLMVINALNNRGVGGGAGEGEAWEPEPALTTWSASPAGGPEALRWSPEFTDRALGSSSPAPESARAPDPYVAPAWNGASFAPAAPWQPTAAGNADEPRSRNDLWDQALRRWVDEMDPDPAVVLASLW